MGSSRGEIRQLLFDLRDSRSTGTKMNDKANRAINLAMKHLVGDLPLAILPDEEHVVLYPDVVGTDATVAARLRAHTADAWVLQFTTPAGTTPIDSTIWVPTVDSTWDGIMHLEVKDPDGVWHRRQSREWWLGDSVYNVSLDRKWRNTTDTLMEFRIHQPKFYLRGDVIKILSPARMWSDERNLLYEVAPHEGFQSDLRDYRGETTGGPPSLFFRQGAFRPGKDMLTPFTAPTLTALGTWVGAEQEGDFSIFYTYTWGRKDAEWQETPGGNAFTPMWESPPSPSATFSHTANPGRIIRIQCPNPDEMLNFDVGGSVREGRTGYRIRVYVARTAIRTAGLGANDLVEADSVPYLLTSFDPDTTIPTGAYNWDGVVLPDRLVRHYAANGYYAYSTFPQADSRYEIDMRVLRQPVDLAHDQDVIPLQDIVMPGFMKLCLHYFAQLDGMDHAAAKMYLDTYKKDHLPDLRHLYENPGGVVRQPAFGVNRPITRYGVFKDAS